MNRRATWAATSLAFVLLAGPGSTAAQGPSASAAPPGTTALPTPETISYEAAAQAELDLIAELRAQAGFAALLGPDGAAILATADAARQEHAEARLPALLQELDAAPAQAFALIDRTGPRPIRTADQAAGEGWSGSLVGQTSGTTSMVLSLAGLLIPTADQDGSGTLTRTDGYDRSSAGSVRERIDLSTTYRMTRGAGRLTFEVEIRSTDVLRDATTGAETARLDGTGRGRIELDACPDPRGVSEGRSTLDWSEQITRAGGQAGARTAATTDAPFSIWVTDDARWSRIDTTIDVRRAAAGPGTPGSTPGAPFDWSAQASVPLTITATGGTVRGPSPATVTGTGAPADQADRTVQGTLGTRIFLVEVAREAERFWRSGKCIELTPTPPSGQVQADATVELQAQAVHRFDAQPVDAPIVATLTGDRSLEPAGTPVPVPGPFRYTAGSRAGDAGTVQLIQTSRRGIGRALVTLTVAGILAGDACGRRNCYSVQQACDQPDLWLIDVSGQVVEAFLTATIAPPEGEAPLVLETPTQILGRTWARWLRGRATLAVGDRPTLTIANKDGRVRVPLTPSDRCRDR